MIHQLLLSGESNAIPGRHLAMLCGLTRRGMTAQVERERRQGFPICASSDTSNPGFYLAEDQGELERYCKTLQHRADELSLTANTMLTTTVWTDDQDSIQKPQKRHPAAHITPKRSKGTKTPARQH